MTLTADNLSAYGPLSDGDLLARYHRKGDQQAFRDLVARHIDWLHAAALRITRNPALAEDVTQGVLLALSRKAPSLAGRSCLAGWLFQATRYASVTAIRAESRRKERERMHSPHPAPADFPPAWDDLKDHLDLAVSRLPAADRQALLLRFYQRMTHEHMAAALGISEEAARKRVTRALDRLRRTLGVVASAPALAVTLTHIPTATASPHLVQGVLAGKVSAKVTLIAKGITLMKIAVKLKLALAVLGLATVGYLITAPALGQPARPAPRSAPGAGSTSSMSAWGNGNSSGRRSNDGTHEITLTTTAGVTTAVVKDAAGTVVFEGPYTTDADKANVPADLAPKLAQLAAPARTQQPGFDLQQWAPQALPAGADPNQFRQQLQRQTAPPGGVNIADFADPTTEMERVLTDLTDDQKAQLKTKTAAARTATTDFRTQANTALQELIQTGDQQAIQDARKTQQSDALALQSQNQLDIESVLTPAQKNTWQAYLLARQIKQKLQPADLTPEQTAKLDAIVQESAKDVVAAPDLAARKKVAGAIYKHVLSDVVTDDQFGLLIER